MYCLCFACRSGILREQSPADANCRRERDINPGESVSRQHLRRTQSWGCIHARLHCSVPCREPRTTTVYGGFLVRSRAKPSQFFHWGKFPGQFAQLNQAYRRHFCFGFGLGKKDPIRCLETMSIKVELYVNCVWWLCRCCRRSDLKQDSPWPCSLSTTCRSSTPFVRLAVSVSRASSRSFCQITRSKEQPLLSR